MSRFVFALARSTGEVVIDDLDGQSRGLTLLRNGIGSAKVSLPLDSAAAALVEPGKSRLKIWRRRSDDEIALGVEAAELVFYGTLATQNYRAQAVANTLALTFFDPFYVLTRRYGVGVSIETYTNVDQGQILWNLIDEQNIRITSDFGPGSDTFLAHGATTTGILRTRSYDRPVVWSAFEDMARQVDGCDFWIDPIDGWAAGSDRLMGNFRAAARRGSVLDDVHFAFGDGTLGNCADMQLTYPELTTYVTRNGTDVATGNALTAIAGDVYGDGFGVLEDLATVSDATTSAALSEAANAVVNSRSVLRPVFVVSPTSEAPRALEHYDLGDTVNVTLEKGAVSIVSEPARVDSIDIEIDQAGGETVRPVFAGADS